MELMTGTKKRAAIYCRVSTKEQAEEGYSIDEQERLLRNLCEKEDYIVVDVYSDRGVSAKNIDGRPEFRRLLQDIREDKIDILLAWKLTRVSRKLKDVLDIVDLLEEYKVQVRFLAEQVDTSTQLGKLQLQMMGMIAEYERETIASNVRLGMIAKAKQGGFLGGQVLGYDSVKTVDENQRTVSKLVVNEKEAKLVREIFRLYIEGKGYKAIVTALNNSGKGYKTKRGTPLSVGTIQGVLKNPLYMGMIQFDKYSNYSKNRKRVINPNMVLTKGQHEPIIDEETWNKAQVLMSMKGGRRENKYHDFTPLTGLLRCPQCGYGMVLTRAPSKKGKVAYYSCGNWKNKGTTVCHCNSVRVDRANEAVFNRVSDFLQSDKMIRAIVKKLNREHEDRIAPAKNQVARLEREIIRLKKKKNKLFDAYEEGILTKEEFVERKEELSNTIERYEVEKAESLEIICSGATEQVSYEVVKDILAKTAEIFLHSDNQQEIKMLLHLLINKITINKLKEIESIEVQLNEDLISYVYGGDASKKEASPFYIIRNSVYENVNIRFVI